MHNQAQHILDTYTAVEMVERILSLEDCLDDMEAEHRKEIKDLDEKIAELEDEIGSHECEECTKDHCPDIEIHK